jgi:hypothetical protein
LLKGNNINRRITSKKYNINEEYFKNIDSPEKAFWLGFFCADGTIRYVKNSVVFIIKQKETKLIELYKSDIQYTGPIKCNVIEKNGFSNNPYCYLQINNQKFINNLMNSGKPRYKKDLHNIPNSILDLYKIDFIRGYFEGDGNFTYDIRNNAWEINICGYYDLLVDIKLYLSKCIQREFGCIVQDKRSCIYNFKTKGNPIVNKIVGLLYTDNSYGIKQIKYKEGNK